MGLEAECTARFGKRKGPGKARLEEKELWFRGAFALRIPLAGATAEAKKDQLHVTFAEGTAVFELGAAAEKWALKIRYPRELLDKLGVKADSRVAVIGLEDGGFLRDLRARTADVSEGKPRSGSSLVFVYMDKRDDLRRLTALRKSIRPDGAIWVLWPKGRKELREDDVRAAGPKAGLVDVKVVSFSEALSGLKLMIPKKLRPKNG